MHRNISKIDRLKKYLARSILFRRLYAFLVRGRDRLRIQRVLSGMKPYRGVHNRGVDASTLHAKILCGYQGWFAVGEDGLEGRWAHYGKDGHFAPGHCTIDLWPDMSEMDPDEKYPTPFKHQNGTQACVFSSYNRKTVLRHFQWMQEHGIDGIFLQRFLNSTMPFDASYTHNNVVTANVQAAANRYGRTWAVMYDLSALQAGDITRIVIEDWKRLVDRMQVTRDKAYLHHRGKPVVAVWGIGFGQNQECVLDEYEELIEFLKHDGQYGGNTLMLGVPVFWRILKRGSARERKLHQLISRADIISPWTVGRYGSPETIGKYADSIVGPDIEWAKQNDVDYLPVVFPGFSWQNLQKTQHQDVDLNQIPRLKGQFLWSQGTAFRDAGAEMLYVAMFDEMDEGTAIFKCTNDPPAGDSLFVTYDGLPSDHYLWLAGKLGELLRNKISGTKAMPVRD